MGNKEANAAKRYSGGFLYDPKADSVLLHKRDSNTTVNPGKWAFFGGLSEGDETPIQTFLREMREELGVDLPGEDARFLCDYFNEELETWRFVFFVESSLPKSVMHLSEGADFEWIPFPEVFGYDLTEKTEKDLRTFSEVREQTYGKYSEYLKSRYEK